MCQIRAKPQIVAKKAVMIPVGVLRGIPIASYAGASGSAFSSTARSLTLQ